MRTLMNMGKTLYVPELRQSFLETSIISMTDADPEIELDDDGGYLQFSVENPNDEKLQTLLEAMIISLKTIEEEYNDYIRIEYM